jgi:hypothetical protein
MIDADEPSAKELKDKYSVDGFPTVLKVRGKGSVKYQGGRTSDGILSFLNNPEN